MIHPPTTYDDYTVGVETSIDDASSVLKNAGPASAPAHEREVAVYPPGTCDTINEGMPGLNDPEHRPSTVRVIGESVAGRPIFAEYWGPGDASTVYVIVVGVHGNECSPTLLVEAVRNEPPTTFGVWLIPALNPDGYADFSRKNANGVDLNRDGDATQPETQALFTLVHDVDPALVFHIHSPSAFVGTYGGDLADAVSRRIATALHYARWNAGSHRNFSWKGLDDAFGQQSVLIELRPISGREASRAASRAAEVEVSLLRSQALSILAEMEP